MTPKKLTILAFAIILPITAVVDTVNVAAQQDRLEQYELNDVPPWINPDATNVCIPGVSTNTGFTTIGPSIEVGATIFGGTWDGNELTRDESDDNGEGLLGSHAGQTMFAELSSPGTQDFAYLAKLLSPMSEHLGWTTDQGSEGFKPGSKFLLTYKGKSIVMEKRDVGGGGGPIEGRPRAIDIWYETAKLIDFREGTAVMSIQQVADDTPVTPLDGNPISNTTTEDTPLSTPSGESTGARVFSFLLGKGLSRNQATGIVANLMQESGGKTLNLKPEIENSIGAYGIAQWLGGRRTALQRYARENGTTEADFSTQVNFLWSELNGSYKNSVLTPIMASATMEESTRIFLERFEIPCTPGRGCDAEFAIRLDLAKKAEAELSGVSGGATNAVTTCANGQSVTDTNDTSPGAVNADGYALPLKNYTPPSNLLNCTRTSCHHDNTPAFDLIVPAGTPVVAIYDGSIKRNRRYTVGTASSDSQCRSVQFAGDDGWVYWYGHTYITHPAGTRFKAGDVIGVVGSKACGLGGAAHLHIDRGSPKGNDGGSDASRDAGFISLMQSIFKNTRP